MPGLDENNTSTVSTSTNNLTFFNIKFASTAEIDLALSPSVRRDLKTQPEDKKQETVSEKPLPRVKRVIESKEYLSESRQATVPLTTSQLKDNLVKPTNYRYLLQNKEKLEIDFQVTTAILQQQLLEENNKKFWLYCYYCACLLEAYFTAYSQYDKAEEFTNLKGQITDDLDEKVSRPQQPKIEEDFIKVVKKSLGDGFRNLKTAPSRLSKIKEYIGFINIYRIYWIFARLSMIEAFKTESILNLFKQFDTCNLDEAINVIKAPQSVYDILSIALFGARLVIEVGIIFKHTFFPTDRERLTNSFEEQRNKVAQILIDFQSNNAGNDGTILSALNACVVESTQSVKDKLNPFSKPIRRERYINEVTSFSAQIYQDLGKITTLKDLEKVLAKADKKLNSRRKTSKLYETYMQQANYVSNWERSSYDIVKRLCTLGNDAGWFIVNFVCNYNKLAKVSDLASMHITAVFLLFDVSINLLKLGMALRKYGELEIEYKKERKAYEESAEKTSKDIQFLQTKQAMVETYLEQLERLNEMDVGQFTSILGQLKNRYKKNDSPSNLESDLKTLNEQTLPQLKEKYKEELTRLLKASRVKYQEKLTTCTGVLMDTQIQIKMQDAKLQELQIKKSTEIQTCFFSISAASLLAAGFSASILLTPLGGYLVCTFAVAMYLSTESFTQYREKKLRLDNALALSTSRSNPKFTIEQKEYEIARNEFIFTLGKNALMPIFLFSAYAVCWPAAILLTVAYLGYEFKHARDQHKVTNEAKRLHLENDPDTKVTTKNPSMMFSLNADTGAAREAEVRVPSLSFSEL